MEDKKRSEIIGGSDIAAVMGMSRWKTPLQLFAEKSGRVENTLSNFEAAEIGTELEEYVSNKFSRKTGVKLRRDSRTFKHPMYPYMVGHIDRWVVGEDALFEAKTTSAYKVKEWMDDNIPQEYILQVMWYLGLVKKKTGYIACLIGGNKFVHKRITFDKKLFDSMVESAKEFKENYLDKDVMPVAVSGDNEFMEQLYPQSMAEKIEHFEGKKEERVNQLIEERVGGLQSVKHAQEEISAIEAELKQLLGDCEMGTTRQYVVTWKNQTREFADTKKLKADDLFEQYKRVSEFRTFRTKKVGGIDARA